MTTATSTMPPGTRVRHMSGRQGVVVHDPRCPDEWVRVLYDRDGDRYVGSFRVRCCDLTVVVP